MWPLPGSAYPQDAITQRHPHPACRYIFALYWAITTLATVGYGDLSAANPAEAVWATIYMFFNLALGAYVLGTITLIVIKHDERTGRYRDLTSHLKDYIRVNEIPPVSHQASRHLLSQSVLPRSMFWSELSW